MSHKSRNELPQDGPRGATSSSREDPEAGTVTSWAAAAGEHGVASALPWLAFGIIAVVMLLANLHKLTEGSLGSPGKTRAAPSWRGLRPATQATAAPRSSSTPRWHMLQVLWMMLLVCECKRFGPCACPSAVPASACAAAGPAAGPVVTAVRWRAVAAMQPDTSRHIQMLS